jgi:hypothetical protein
VSALRSAAESTLNSTRLVGVAVEVRRPAVVGRRTPGEWAWKLFAY